MKNLNKTRQITKSLMGLGTTLLASNLSAKPFELPRGIEIEPIAGNCPIGEIPRTSKAGHYNSICHEMSDAEKCLALLKSSFRYVEAVEKTPAEEEAPQHRWTHNEKKKLYYCADLYKQAFGLPDTITE